VSTRAASNSAAPPDPVPAGTAPVLSKTVGEAYIDIFRALSEPVRMQIVSLIHSAQGNEYPCTSLEKNLPVSKSTISYHVKILSQAGLVNVRKEGRYFRYWLRVDVFDYFIPQFLARLEDVTGDGDARTS
jgi:ArsR family transcriptional regulator